jgi:hypothetical protein
LNAFCILNFFLNRIYFFFKTTTTMKKSLLFAILGFSSVLFAASCSKSGTTGTTNPPPGGTSPQGNWVGNRNNGFGGAAFYFAVNLQASGVLVVSDNSAVAPDIANGTWSLVADSVRATYTFAGTATTYSLAGKYTTTSNIINGTIGLGTSTTGAGVFSVTKQ